MSNITVLGVGNTVMTDDGFGVRVIEALSEKYQFENVKFIDGGTIGMGLMPFIEGTNKLLVVDAINAEGEAGEYFRFEGDELAAYFSNKISVHDLGLNDLLALLEVTDNKVDETIVIGVKPQKVTLGVGLTPVIKQQIKPTMDKVLEIITNWGAKKIIDDKGNSSS